jgi:hypothetical protein
MTDSGLPYSNYCSVHNPNNREWSETIFEPYVMATISFKYHLRDAYHGEIAICSEVEVRGPTSPSSTSAHAW